MLILTLSGVTMSKKYILSEVIKYLNLKTKKTELDCFDKDYEYEAGYQHALKDLTLFITTLLKSNKEEV